MTTKEEVVINMTNTAELLKEIELSGLKKIWIAKKIGLSYFALLNKIHNKSQFKAGEIKSLCSLLGIDSLEKRDLIFFANGVDKMTT